ncbi:flagellar basal-body rod protein FlgF [Oceanicola sp. 22II-s10i]|uniref:flagellar basal-body rod protein FlgF n=1 Tax=Oceanicola sp. 22II-s10i TaxID=1317116 RepID=UPI000B528F49|nr:flagellar basal-body rod protein FlgF [Oceanicola sp. 22II-s10i]OWU83189.1 flagellar basal-body rod protein FlgF [Oceanicola sp. 22II-s10i]
MDNTTYVALSQMTALERQLDVTANNLANLNSDGFKSERVLFESYLYEDTGAEVGDGTNFVLDRGSYVDERQGALTRTDNPLHVALMGKGWFGYQLPDGSTAFGRDGRFVMDQQGNLMTMTGAQVLDEGGGPIALPPDIGSSLVISPDGTISTNDGGAVARIGMFDLPDLQSYERMGNGLYVAPQGAVGVPQQEAATEAVQGSIEASNVDPISEVTRLIMIQRAYQRAADLIDSEHSLKKDMLSRLGRATM